MEKYYAVIIAGGRGERFWPLSTARAPKQLLKLFGGRSLLAQAVERLDGLIAPARRFLVTTAAIREAVLRDAADIPPENIVGEPFGRDTAAAIAVGCALVRARDPDAAFCVLTADHLIGPVRNFQDDLRKCLEAALKRDRLLTIGIRPAHASEAFGYLETAPPEDDAPFLPVRRFVEKPDRERARRYLEAGNYYWNSGMFVWSVKTLGGALARHQPALAAFMDALGGDIGSPERLTRRLADLYPDLPKISIDYALMEKAGNVRMLPAGFEWHDVGSWSAVAERFPADPAGNTAVGPCLAVDAADNIVVTPDDRLVALLGIEGVAVVNSGRATLVCRADRLQEVKRVVEKLGADARFKDYL